MKSMSRNSLIKVFGVIVLCIMVVFSSTVLASAVDVDPDDEALDTLKSYVADEIANNDYKVEGGGTVRGSSILNAGGITTSGSTKSTSGSIMLDEKVFNSLTSKAQSDVVSDIARYSYDAIDAEDVVTEDTVENWWRELQQSEGVGSKFLNVVLENTKPDFVSANKIYKPFSGIIGTVMGLIAVVGMGLLGIVLVADIFYIVIPPVRMLVAEGEQAKDGKFPVSKVFSNDAIYAIKVAEADGDAGGSKKQALGIYLGRRVPMLILLGICLLYLVSGEIYTLVGWILDLVKGFI